MAETNLPTQYMLTTVDNPFDPFTEFEEWHQFDIEAGYNSLAFLDRVAKISPDTSETDQVVGIQDAIDEIVRENVSGMWRKVSRNSAKSILPEV